mmetsp:Transcript_105477/g.308383  ORF Transcript_105477/g.308383 Transcript_105477/m.308383 type:complete len:244 (-) Transcript_105477:8-739(-)
MPTASCRRRTCAQQPRSGTWRRSCARPCAAPCTLLPWCLGPRRRLRAGGTRSPRSPEGHHWSCLSYCASSLRTDPRTSAFRSRSFAPGSARSRPRSQRTSRISVVVAGSSGIQKGSGPYSNSSASLTRGLMRSIPSRSCRSLSRGSSQSSSARFCNARSACWPSSPTTEPSTACSRLPLASGPTWQTAGQCASGSRGQLAVGSAGHLSRCSDTLHGVPAVATHARRGGCQRSISRLEYTPFHD